MEETKKRLIENIENMKELKTNEKGELENQYGLKEKIMEKLNILVSLKEEMVKKIKEATTIREIEDIRVEYLGKKGPIMKMYSMMKDLSEEERKKFGFYINTFKDITTEGITTYIKNLKEEEINAKLESEKIDITLPATEIKIGSPNILEKLVEEVEEVFLSMGYDVVDGPEIEEDKYNFEMLNIPKGHPARDAQDTFYIEGEEILLRSQTSPVQVRSMLKGEGKVPIRMICPGKTYRRDDDDATHSHQFMQIEGLLVDKNVCLTDLKGTIDVIAKKLFGSDVESRFRPSYYQFTEPSVEVDISCFNCKGKGCPICKQTGFITIAGAGMVHPNVLRMSGYDPKKWSGFAFGFGAERMAMLKYDIKDCRVFYNTDLRETEGFDRREVEDD